MCEILTCVCDAVVCVCVCVQTLYREDGRRDLCVNLYSLMPDTPDTEFAREMRDLQSEVRRHKHAQTRQSHDHDDDDDDDDDGVSGQI